MKNAVSLETVTHTHTHTHTHTGNFSNIKPIYLRI